MANEKENGGKKNFALRLRPDLLKALERWAADEFRSTNGQIEYLLQEAFRKAGRLPKQRSEGNQEANPSSDDGPTSD